MSALTQNDAFARPKDVFPEHRKGNYISFFFGEIRRSAVIETFAFFLASILLNALFGDGARFIQVNPHPFWIIILLVTVQYGQREAIFAALLATAFLLVGNMPEQSMTETMYDYYFRIFLQPLLWIIMALLLGSIRSRQFREREDLFERLWKSEESTHILATSYIALKHIKERLELRLTEERRSVLTVYQMARAIQSSTKDSLLGNIERLVTIALKPKKFSLFWCENDAFVLAKSVGWKNEDTFANRFGKNSGIMRHILKDKRTLSVVNEHDDKILAAEGLLAGPVIEEKSGKLLGLLKIEEMELIDLGINAHETFGIVCEWIALAAANVDKQQKMHIDGIRLSRKNLIGIGKPPSIGIILPELFREARSEVNKQA